MAVRVQLGIAWPYIKVVVVDEDVHILVLVV